MSRYFLFHFLTVYCIISNLWVSSCWLLYDSNGLALQWYALDVDIYLYQMNTLGKKETNKQTNLSPFLFVTHVFFKA